MVRASLQYYYTFKKVGDIVECHKWEEGTGDPVGITYKIKPGQIYMGCDCPAWRKCKHQTCVEEAIESGKINELWKWKWSEKKGWQELNDIQPLEEM
jgi:hypothetical protein